MWIVYGVCVRERVGTDLCENVRSNVHSFLVLRRTYAPIQQESIRFRPLITAALSIGLMNASRSLGSSKRSVTVGCLCSSSTRAVGLIPLATCEGVLIEGEDGCEIRR